MRNYFWIRENSRGNVYTNAQRQGLSENTIKHRNDYVDSAPLRTDCGYYPDKAFILHEFKKASTFDSERTCLVKQMTGDANGWYRLEPSLRCAINQAGDYVANGYQVAITAYASMLNKTLIHYWSKPNLADRPCGEMDYYDCNSHKLLLSNEEKIKRCIEEDGCGLIYYHPFAFEYGFRVKPAEGLKVSAGRCWLGIEHGNKTGNISWNVKAEEGYGFVDFANFGCGNRCQGFPQYGSSKQETRLAGHWNGIPVYKDSGCKEEVFLNGCNQYELCGTYIGRFGYETPTYADTQSKYFYAPVEYATCQQVYYPYDEFPNWGCSSCRISLFRAETIVWLDCSAGLGVDTPYYRNFAREQCGKLWAGNFQAMHSWMKQNLQREAYDKMMASAGKVLGIYGAKGGEFCGKPIGAIVQMQTDGTCEIWNSTCGKYCSQVVDYGKGTLLYAGPQEHCALVGDFTFGCNDGRPTIGWMSPRNETAYAEGNPPRNIVTINSRKSVEARLNLERICATVWDAVARVRFKLDASDDWEDYSSDELWVQFQTCMNDWLYVYFTASGAVHYTIEEAGVEGYINAWNGNAYFTLYKLAKACGLEPSAGNIGDVYELLTAGVTVAFDFNEWRTDTPPYANVSAIGLSPNFNDEPCVNWFC